MYNGGIRGIRGGDKYGIVSGRDSFVQVSSPAPSISYYKVTDVSYNILDDTSVAVGGTVVVYGNGFVNGMTIYLGTTLISSYTVLGSTRVTFVVPSVSFGTYNLLMYYGSGTASILIPGISVSAFPTWATGSYSSQTSTINIQLQATGDGTLNYYLQSGSSLPTGVTLSSTGLLSGTISGAVSGTVYSFTVLVDDAQLQTSQQTVTLSLLFNDTNFNTTTLLLNGETSVTPFITDSSTNNFGLTVVGDTKPLPFIPYYNDGYYSVYGGSTSDYLQVASNAVFAFPGAFTVEGWFYWPAIPAGGPLVGVMAANGFQFYTDGSTYLGFNIYGSSNVCNTSSFPSRNVWHHIAMTRDGSNNCTIWVDGVSSATGTSSFSFVQGAWSIYGGSSNGGSGYISNLRVVKGTALYTTGFTPSTTPLTAVANTVLLTCQSSRFIDKSTNNFTLTVGGSPSISPAIPFTNPSSVIVKTDYSVYFGGTSYTPVTIATASSQLNLPGDFTVELWFYDIGTSKSLEQFAWSSTGGFACGINTIDGNATRKLDWRSTGSAPVYGVTAITANAWHHAAYVKSGTTFIIFLDGKVEYSSTSYSTTFTSTTTYLGGANNADAAYSFLGYISNFRVVKGSAVYSIASTTVGTQVFTPSTSPLTAIANTALLTCQTDSMLKDNSTNALTIVGDSTVKVVNNTYPFTLAPNTVTVSNLNILGSTYFDGTGDYLSIGTTQLWTPSNNLTIEGWFNISTTGDRCIYAKDSGTSGSSRGLFIYITSTGAVSVFYSVSGSSEAFATSSTGLVVANQWYHLAVVKNGSSCAVYLNGVSIATFTAATIACPSSPTNYIGIFNASYPMLGYISDLRIVNGTALYTSNFAPTVSPLTAVTNTQLLTLQYNGGANNYGIIDNSPFQNILTRSGNTSQGTFSPYSVTGWSNYFNGSTDYLTTPASGSFLQNTFFGASKTFTVEAWLYQTAQNISGSYFSIVLGDASGASGTNMNWCCGMDNANKPVIAWYDSTSKQALAANALSLNTWNHVAWIVTSGVTTIYINGVNQTLSGTTTLTNPLASTAIVIGVDRARYYTGYISNLRAIYGTALYTTAFTPSTIPLTPITNTIFLTCQSNRFIDNSVNNLTLTTTGTPSVQAYSPFGSIREATPLSYSNYFGTTTMGWQTPASSATNIIGTATLNSTSTFTVEAWIYPLARHSGGGAALGYVFGSMNITGGQADWTIGPDSTGKLTVFWYNSGNYLCNSTNVIPLNTWTHIAVSISTGAISMYINGVKETLTGTTTATTTSGSPLGYLSSGGYTYGGTTWQGFNGYISNLRVVKSALYSSTSFTISTTPLTAIANTSLLSCQSTTIKDNSTNAYTLTVTNALLVSKYNPFGYTAQTSTSYSPSLHGGSAYFDGTGDWIYAPSIPKYSNQNHTIEFWAYFNNVGSRQTILNQGWASGSWSTDGGWTLDVGVGAGQLSFALGTMASGSFWISTGVVVTTGQWHHIAIVRNGTTVTIFVNGVSAVTGTLTSSTTYMSNMGLLRVGIYDSLTLPFNGYVTDIRISSGALYTSSFYPNSAPLSVTTSIGTFNYTAGLLLNFNNGGIIDYHSSNVLETVGNAQLSTSVKKYGNASMSFNPSSTSYLITPVSSLYNIGAGDSTVEGWFYFNSLTLQNQEMFVFSGATTFNYTMFVWDNGNIYFRSAQSSGDIVTTFASGMSTGVWYHWAVTRVGNLYTIYKNGASIASATSTAIINENKSFSAGKNMNGYIDDLRITKFARYTGNFTPSTTQLITL